MTPQEMYRTRPENATPKVRRWGLVAFAAGFLLLYLTADFVVANLASSLAWFNGAALILLGRLLCMAWTISAAVSATRRLVRGTWS